MTLNKKCVHEHSQLRSSCFSVVFSFSASLSSLTFSSLMCPTGCRSWRKCEVQMQAVVCRNETKQTVNCECRRAPVLLHASADLVELLRRQLPRKLPRLLDSRRCERTLTNGCAHFCSKMVNVCSLSVCCFVLANLQLCS